LIAQHNLSANNLRHIDESLGGYMPAPSIGIAKKEHPLSGFGEITLLAKPGLIDPAKGVPVKGADIYSTRHPRPRFKVNEKNLRTLMAELKPSKEAVGGYTSDLAERVNEHGVDAALRDRDVRKVFEHAFLKEQGINVESKTRDVPLFQSDIAKTKAMKEFFEKSGIEGNHEFGGAYHKGLSDAVRAAIREVAEKLPEEDREDYVKIHDEWFGISKDDKGLVDFSKTWKFVQDAGKLGKKETDPYAMEDLVRKKVEEIGQDKFEKWAKEKIKDAVGEPYIRKFSENTGNEIRRAYTVDNILREMTKKLARGEANMYGFGEGYRGKISFDNARALPDHAHRESEPLHVPSRERTRLLRVHAQGRRVRPRGSVADFEKLRAWLGVKAGEAPSTSSLKTFARGFEGYLLEGKAPAAGLRDAFRAFDVAQARLPLDREPRSQPHRRRSRRDGSNARDGREIEEARQNIGFEPMKKPEGDDAGRIHRVQGTVR
jgi:hypothetical protein